MMIAIPDGPIKINGMTWLGIAFIPWTIFWILNGFSANTTFTIILPLLVSMLIYMYRRKYISVTWMDCCAVIFFTISAVITLLGADVITGFGTIFSYIALAGAWLGTLVGDVPLTTDYAKWNYPAPIVNSTLFSTINRILTGFWGSFFLIQAVLSIFVIVVPDYKIVWSILNYLLLIPAYWFTGWFPNWYPTHFATVQEHMSKVNSWCGRDMKE